MSDRENPEVILQRVLDQMTPDNWESYGWGDAVTDPNEGTACLLHQVAIAGEINLAEREAGVYRHLNKTVQYLLRAIRKKVSSPRGRWAKANRDYPENLEDLASHVESFNDDGITTYKDARAVVREALALVKEDSSG